MKKKNGILIVPEGSMDDVIRARYLIESALPLEQAADVMAGEQSTGTFVKLPPEMEDLVRGHAARVQEIKELEAVAEPSLPGAAEPLGVPGELAYRRAEVVLAWPLANMGTSLPNVLSTVAGNLYELRQFSGLRLIDLELPDAFLDAYPGPRFGVAGTREISGVQGRPLIGTIVKPSVGLSPEETARLVKKLVEAGIDFIKDDELQCDGPHCPFSERVAAVMRVINEHADRTGKKVMHAFNITGELDQMRRRHDLVLHAGGTCVMVSLNSVGLTGVADFSRHSQLPIHGHRNGWGLYTRAPLLGMSFAAYHKFWRVAGVDQIHVNGLRNKFCEDDESVIASARACLTPLFSRPGQGCEVMPVFSSGQWAGQAPDTYRALGSTDLIYACGGGIMAHPGGVAAGVRSIRQAWELAVAGKSLEEGARESVELQQALEKFGG